jgi:imidazolonepropionase-like amidohydrolase
MTLTLHGGSVVDGTGSDPRNADVIITDARITDVVVGGVGPAATSVDVTGLTLLPGLIDLHTHMGLVNVGEPEWMAPAVTAAHLFRNAELCLQSGHTTAREVAGADGGLRQAIDAGLIPGPRLFPSGPILCQSGGHGDIAPPFFSHHHRHDPGVPGLAQGSLVCDGADEVRIAARTAFRRGATQIKMCVSGGVVSLTDSLDDTQFTVEELRAAVIEAQARGSYVTAHAHNVRAILNGLEAGLECFEHGTFLDEPTAARMAAAGAALVPTLSVLDVMTDKWQEWGVPEAALPRLAGVREAMMASIKIAHDAGVVIGSGTDILGPGQDGRGLELALKARALDPMAAIVSATSTSAKILRRPDLGVLRSGATADVIAVDFDPLTEPELWVDPDRVVLVVKDGLVVKDTRPA